MTAEIGLYGLRFLKGAVVRIGGYRLGDAVEGNVVDLLDLGHVDAGRQRALVGQIVGLELGGIEIEAALDRFGGYGADLEGAIGRIVDRSGISGGSRLFR